MAYITNHLPRPNLKKEFKRPDHPNIVAIFDDLYVVGIHRSMRKLTSELATEGEYVTGDRQIDRNAMMDIEPVPMTINRMVEHFRDGADIYLRSSEQASKIYDAIERHLAAWRNLVNEGLGVSDGPLDDLIVMDRFSLNVFRVAKYFKANKVYGEGFHNFSNLMYTGGSSSTLFIDGQALPTASVGDIVHPEDLTHESGSTVFQRALVESRMGNRG